MIDYATPQEKGVNIASCGQQLYENLSLDYKVLQKGKPVLFMQQTSGV